MKTRQQYLNREVTHEEYYGQFVTPEIKEAVKGRIGIKGLNLSTDKHLNDIPLSIWDSMLNTARQAVPKLKEAGDFMTMAVSVCILKQAARELIHEHTTTNNTAGV